MRVLDALPRTPTGKLLRRALRDAFKDASESEQPPSGASHDPS
jgi:acyl-coenzyme A synthetase/AMP-(fatty) acid ligase